VEKIIEISNRLLLFLNIYFKRNPFKIYEFRSINAFFKQSKYDTVLDLGCGKGTQSFLFAKQCNKLMGIDIDAESINWANKWIKEKNMEFLHGRIENLCFDTNKFDAIISFCVIEHIPNYTKVLEECFRCLKTGASMIFSADSLATIESPQDITKHKKDCLVEHYFTKREMEEILTTIGFSEVLVAPIARSKFSARLFSIMLHRNNGFRMGILSTLICYLLIRINDLFISKKSKGIFLIVKCTK